MTSPLTYRFLDCELDVGAYQLRRQGQPVRLERQPMDLLIYLVERHGQLVSRDEIVERLWGKGVFVDVETGVHTAMRKIRLALRDSAEDPRYVETVTGKGYRFVAPVEAGGTEPVVMAPAAREGTTDAPPAPVLPPARRRVPRGVLVAAAVILTGLAFWAGTRPAPARSPVTVAVLPFENMSGDPERQYLADGLAEEMIAAFGQIDPDHVRVIGRTSVMAYKGTRKTLAEIGRELGAEYVVEGSIRTDGGRLRVTSRLVQLPDQTQVWSASFDREPGSVVALQHEIGNAIASQMRVRLSPQRLGALARRHTRDAEAYDLYLRGRFFWNQLTPATNRRALEYFERAIAIDPEYALAWAGIANVTVASSINSDTRPSDVAPRAREAALRAVARGGEIPDAHDALGAVHFMLDWDWPAAENAFRRAIALDPGDALAHRMLGHVLSQAGRQGEGARLVQRARELEPLYAMNHAISSQVAFQGRDFEGAVQHARRAVALDPQFWIGHVQLGQACEQVGRNDCALEALLDASRFSGGNSKAAAMRGHLLARMGRTDEARAVLTALDAASRDRYIPPYARALVHAGLGEREPTFDRLDEACAEKDVHLIFLTVDPKWDSYRDDARFRAVLERCGLKRSPAS